MTSWRGREKEANLAIFEGLEPTTTGYDRFPLDYWLDLIAPNLAG